MAQGALCVLVFVAGTRYSVLGTYYFSNRQKKKSRLCVVGEFRVAQIVGAI